MPGVMESFVDDSRDYEAPVTSLKEGLPMRELLKNRETEFEIAPEEDEESGNVNSAEAYLNFDDVQSVINLEVLDNDEEKDGEDGTPFDKFRRKMHDLRKDGKLKKFMVRHGTGDLVPENSIVYIWYQAYLEYQEVPFDSTLMQGEGKRDEPKSYNLAKGEVLPGLHEAILSMRKNEKAEFLVHYDLAFGRRGCPPRIPPESTILFVVEVDRFVDCGDALLKNDADLSMEERTDFSNSLKRAKAYHLIGNDKFKNGNFSQAAQKYRQTINIMHNARLADEAEEKERNKFLLKIYCNVCLCYNKLKQHRSVCSMANDAMRVSPQEAWKNAKLQYAWGYAKMMLNDFQGAEKHLKTAHRLANNDALVTEGLQILERKKREAVINEKMMWKKAMGSLPPTSVKISEVAPEEVEFRNYIKSELNDFKNQQSNSSYIMKEVLTDDEEKIVISLAKEIGLYARVAAGEKRVIHIKKPADM